MSNNKIKVVGYAQKVVYNGSIEYRNFTPDLVGVQLANNGGTPLFTMGNFSVTTNFDQKIDKTFVTNNFSNFTTLNSLDLTLQQTLGLLTDNAGVILNLDKRNLTNYALFNSFSEFIRVALENIIINFPAALYLTPLYQPTLESDTLSGKTYEDYNYNPITSSASFKVNTYVVNNKYQLNFLKNGSLQNTFNVTNDMRNVSVNYQSYAVLLNNIEYNIIGFTGSTNIGDYLYFEVSGNPFSETSGFINYHIKPNSINENLFYNRLPTFEYYLLNRQSAPKYTANFKFTTKSDSGDILYTNDSITWPVSDGYNLDFDTSEYVTYITKLLKISNDFDSTTANLMSRFLVTDSITDFDTTSTHVDPLDQDTSGQKINKTLTVYGVEFDKINNFIQGIKFANVVSYDKQNNTPDIYIKNLAKVLGWDLISSVLENDLLKTYIEPKKSTYSGHSTGLTLIEADVELWRRLILNTPWLWKSKGSRKSIEFLFRFIGTPLGLIKFNEHIYLAENKLDVTLFQNVLKLNGKSSNISIYPIDGDGYPNPLPNTPNMYFQGKGLWYRETGGPNATLDINTGNNPHAGPYDGGSMYINQFKTLIPNFSSVTVSSQTVTTTTRNLFSNYKMGTFDANTSKLYVDIVDDNGVDFSNAYVVTNTVITDPKSRLNLTNNGCDIPIELKSLEINLAKADQPHKCTTIFNVSNGEMGQIRLNQYGYVNFQISIPNTVIEGATNTIINSIFIDKTCCSSIRGIPFTPYYYNQVIGNQTPFTPVNSGYICCNANNTCGCFVTCKWLLDNSIFTKINGTNYLVFIDETGNKKIVSQDGCNCPSNFTTAIKITDPNTNEIGFGCRLDISPSSGDIGQLQQTFVDRTTGVLNCDEQYSGF